MADIVTSLPFSITNTIERRIREGLDWERVTSRAREIQAAKVNREQSEAVVDPNGLGLRRIATIPAHEFYRMNEKYGNESWGDDDHMASLRKYAPELTTKHTPYKQRMRAKETIIYTGRK